MSGPRYFDEVHETEGPDYFGKKNKPKTGAWKQHEKDIAERTGDQQVRGSGNQPGRPGDTMGADCLRDGKLSQGAGITIRASWLAKLLEESLSMGKRPVLEVRLEAAKLPVPRDWVFIPAADYDDLRERAGWSI